MQTSVMTRALNSIFLFMLLLAAPAFAIEPGEALKDSGLEARARTLSSQLRCLVCQNQSIDDSQAPLARDLRLLVRERLVGGDSDAQVLDFLQQRYGDFVLLKPPFKPQTWLLWGAPGLLLLAGASALGAAQRRRRSESLASTPPLDEAEQQALDQLLPPQAGPKSAGANSA